MLLFSLNFYPEARSASAEMEVVATLEQTRHGSVDGHRTTILLSLEMDLQQHFNNQ